MSKNLSRKKYLLYLRIDTKAYKTFQNNEFINGNERSIQQLQKISSMEVHNDTGQTFQNP